jgi:hypothetical protein
VITQSRKPGAGFARIHVSVRHRGSACPGLGVFPIWGYPANHNRRALTQRPHRIAPARQVRVYRPAAVRIVSLLTALLMTAPVGGGAERAPKELFGTNAQGVLASGGPATWAPKLAAMGAAGLSVVRFDARWGVIEPSGTAGGAHRYRWSAYDAIVRSLAQAHLRWYPVLDYSAPWASSRPGFPYYAPADPAAFAAFAGALAARYGRGGSFWRSNPRLPAKPVESYEIWNEENGGYFWRPAPDPGGYADLYLAARTAIRAHDPAAQAVVGGLTEPGAAEFLSGMLAARPALRGQIDAAGLHPYEQTAQLSAVDVLDLRAALYGLGLGGVPIEITEVGWTTRGQGAVSDASRAADYRWLTRWAATCGRCGVTRFLPHTWVTRERAAFDRSDWFGLYHPSGVPTQAGIAYAQTVRSLSAR